MPVSERRQKIRRKGLCVFLCCFVSFCLIPYLSVPTFADSVHSLSEPTLVHEGYSLNNGVGFYFFNGETGSISPLPFRYANRFGFFTKASGQWLPLFSSQDIYDLFRSWTWNNHSSALSSTNTSFSVSSVSGGVATDLFVTMPAEVSGTYLGLMPFSYDPIPFPGQDKYIKVTYSFDLFWNPDRTGAAELESYLTSSIKPRLLLSSSVGSSSSEDRPLIEPSSILLTYAGDRSYACVAYFLIDQALIDEVAEDYSPEYPFDQFQFILTYPYMLPSAGSRSRTYRISTYQLFPISYDLLDGSGYYQELYQLSLQLNDISQALNAPLTPEQLRLIQQISGSNVLLNDATQDYTLALFQVEDVISRFSSGELSPPDLNEIDPGFKWIDFFRMPFLMPVVVAILPISVFFGISQRLMGV